MAKKLDWFYPEKPSEIKGNDRTPRNTHVVVQFTPDSQRNLRRGSCVQPYAEQKLEPFFGLERDKDGNLIRWHEDNDTFWADNPRYGIDGDTREYIHMRISTVTRLSNSILTALFLCVERIYRDWIHGDDDEHDSEYYFEKRPRRRQHDYCPQQHKKPRKTGSLRIHYMIIPERTAALREADRRIPTNGTATPTRHLSAVT